MDYWVVIMGALRGVARIGHPSLLENGDFFLLYVGSFHYFFLLIGGPFFHVGAILLPFSRCLVFLAHMGSLLMKLINEICYQ